MQFNLFKYAAEFMPKFYQNMLFIDLICKIHAKICIY